MRRHSLRMASTVCRAFCCRSSGAAGSRVSLGADLLTRGGLAALVGCIAWPGDLEAQAPLAPDVPLIVTQAPRQDQTPPPNWDAQRLARSEAFEGARLVVVSPDGSARILSEGFHSACDPDVSFDGQRVLFAGRKESASEWRIWEIGLDGKGLRAVSPPGLDARSPIHVSTLFTLDSPEPWFTTVFVGWDQTLNEGGQASASSLYNIKLDGTELRRLTFNPNHNVDPFQMADGRVIYAAERYPLEPGAPSPSLGIYAIHVEGADMEFFGGEQGRRIQQMPCATERGLVVFVEADAGRWDGAGQLACVHESRPHRTYRRLTDDASWLYLHPSPWRENILLVSRRATDVQGTWGVVGFNAETRRCEPVFDSTEYDEVQAVAVKPRNQPDGHSTVVNPQFGSGTFYGLNCYTAEPMREAHLKSGAIKRVRFLEGVVQKPAPAVSQRSVSGGLVPRRLIGEAPVEEDGSFNVEVPADTPVLVQTLDERGLALGTSGWIWVKPKETRGCIGCHEDPELVPENEYVRALRRPSNRLLLPPEQRRRLTFCQDIAPILQQHCATADCHGGANTPLPLPLTAEHPAASNLEKAYAALLAPVSPPANSARGVPVPGRYVDAGRARTSWLIWQLCGTDTSRPWDETGASAQGKTVQLMPPPGQGRPLSDERFRIVGQWIDLGAPYDATSTSELPVAAHLPTPAK